mgnify:CR=1 FL=1
MKSLIFASILLITQACDQPVRTRDPLPTDSGTSAQNFTDNTSGDTSEDGITEPSTGGGDNPIPGFDNCILDYQYFATNIGSFGICQSERLENRFN